MRDFERRANVISNCPEARSRCMRVTVRYLLCVGTSDEALNASSRIAGFTDVFQVVTFLALMADSVQPRLFGNF
jgi:hypothetical protein